MMVGTNGQTINRHKPTATVSNTIKVIHTVRGERDCGPASLIRLCTKFKHRRNRFQLQVS